MEQQVVDYNGEMLSFDEKIRLAKLEEGKAAVRVHELEFEKARFALNIYRMSKQQQEQGAPPPAQPAQPQPQGQ